MFTETNTKVKHTSSHFSLYWKELGNIRTPALFLLLCSQHIQRFPLTSCPGDNSFIREEVRQKSLTADIQYIDKVGKDTFPVNFLLLLCVHIVIFPSFPVW